MNKISVRRITDLSNDALIDRLANIAARAFLGQPLNIAFLGGDLSIDEEMWCTFIRAGIIGGETYVAGIGDQVNDSDVAGFAVWYGPGQGFHLHEDQRKNSGYDEVSQKRSPESRKWEEEVLLPMCDKLDEDTIGSSAKLASYLLQFLAVAPESQGKGIGKALVTPIQSQADKFGIDTCLETATDLNITIYKRMGYTVLGSITIPCDWGDAPFHLMHRRANAPNPEGAANRE